MSDEQGTAPDRPRWVLGDKAGAVTLALVVLVELWAGYATEPDYYLPDFFRPLVVAAALWTLFTGFVRSERIRRWLRASVWLFVASVLLLESYNTFRGAGDDQYHIVSADDALLRYHYRPGETLTAAGNDFTINHLGLWDNEYEVPKPDGVYRIIALGGSMGNDGAIAMEDRYHVRLEALLADAHPAGSRVEVVNVSCEGFNTLQQVRFLETVGLRYDPDVVVVAYQMSDPFLQDGSARKIGNSVSFFRFALPAQALLAGSKCRVFEPFYGNYGYRVMVEGPLNHLALLGQHHDFESFVAVMPMLEEFDDPMCAAMYDHVVDSAQANGLQSVRVADAFVGSPVADFIKPGEPFDLTHPNPAGHRLIAETLADRLRSHIQAHP